MRSNYYNAIETENNIVSVSFRASYLAQTFDSPEEFNIESIEYFIDDKEVKYSDVLEIMSQHALNNLIETAKENH